MNNHFRMKDAFQEQKVRTENLIGLHDYGNFDIE